MNPNNLLRRNEARKGADLALLLSAATAATLTMNSLQHVGAGAGVFFVLGCTLVVAAIVHALTHLSKPLFFFFASLSVSVAAETIGVTIGLPFGHYQYVDSAISLLSPQFWILGVVPPSIPMMWFTLGYLGLHVGKAVAKTWKWIPISALMLMSLDVIVDPLQSGRRWVWLVPGQLYGVPLANFLGWFLVATAFYSAYDLTRPESIRISPIAIATFLLVSTLLAADALLSGLRYATMLGLPPILITSGMALRNTRRGQV